MQCILVLTALFGASLQVSAVVTWEALNTISEGNCVGGRQQAFSSFSPTLSPLQRAPELSFTGIRMMTSKGPVSPPPGATCTLQCENQNVVVGFDLSSGLKTFSEAAGDNMGVTPDSIFYLGLTTFTRTISLRFWREMPGLTRIEVVFKPSGDIGVLDVMHGEFYTFTTQECFNEVEITLLDSVPLAIDDVCVGITALHECGTTDQLMSSGPLSQDDFLSIPFAETGIGFDVEVSNSLYGVAITKVRMVSNFGPTGNFKLYYRPGLGGKDIMSFVESEWTLHHTVAVPSLSPLPPLASSPVGFYDVQLVLPLVLPNGPWSLFVVDMNSAWTRLTPSDELIYGDDELRFTFSRNGCVFSSVGNDTCVRPEMGSGTAFAGILYYATATVPPLLTGTVSGKPSTISSGTASTISSGTASTTSSASTTSPETVSGTVSVTPSSNASSTATITSVADAQTFSGDNVGADGGTVIIVVVVVICVVVSCLALSFFFMWRKRSGRRNACEIEGDSVEMVKPPAGAAPTSAARPPLDAPPVYAQANLIDTPSAALPPTATPPSYASFSVYRKYSPEIISSAQSRSGQYGIIPAAQASVVIPELDPEMLVTEAQIGSGQFGVVYSGWYGSQRVAIKVLKNERGDEALAEFLAEAAMMARAGHHKNVLEFIGVTQTADCPTLVTKFCSGASLENLIESRPLRDTEVLKISASVAAGMAHLARSRIVHRDLASRNVLLEEDQNPLIADLGMARMLESGNSAQKTNATVGPLRWFAPECLNEKTYSEKSDVWAFGCTIIEMLTRACPYDELGAVEAATLVMEHRLRPAVPNNCPKKLVGVLPLCFEWATESRPSFEKLYSMLK